MSVRLWGGLAAIVFGVLFAWVIMASFGQKDVVTPTVAVGAGERPGADAKAKAGTTLAKRTELQSEASVADGAKSLELGSAGERLSMQRHKGGDRGVVRQWLSETGQGGSAARGTAPGTPGAGAAGQKDLPKLLQAPDFRSGVSTLPYRESNVLVQPQGRDFRRARNDGVRWAGGWLIFGALLACALFLLGRGRIGTVQPVEGGSEAKVVRFNALERGTHWMTAVSFIVMALTGLVVLYGKWLLLPWMGRAAFSALAGWSAWLHMASAVPFVLGVVVMTVMWLAQNVPTREDWTWLKRGGGFLSDDRDHPPAGRFNAGQKIMFWGVLLGGLALLATGLSLMFPFYWFGYDGMEWSQLLHASIALAMIALIIGHIYIGSVGMVGAFQAMWSGLVDRGWARQHHRLWFDRLQGGRRSE